MTKVFALLDLKRLKSSRTELMAVKSYDPFSREGVATKVNITSAESIRL